MNKRVQTCLARDTPSQVQCITLFFLYITSSWTEDRSTYSTGALACRTVAGRKADGQHILHLLLTQWLAIVWNHPLAILQRRPLTHCNWCWLSQLLSMKTDSVRLPGQHASIDIQAPVCTRTGHEGTGMLVANMMMIVDLNVDLCFFTFEPIKTLLHPQQPINWF